MSTAEQLVLDGRTYRHEPVTDVKGNVIDHYVGTDNAHYRLHENGGGLVATTAYVEKTVHVGPQCRVFGNARIFGDIRLTGRAQVGGTLIASGSLAFARNAYLTSGTFFGSNKIITRDERVG